MEIAFILTLIAILMYFLLPFIRRKQEAKRINQVTSVNRGTKSERDLVLHLLKIGIPKETVFHDLYIEKGTSAYSQIDVVVPISEGILVFEVKDLSGWLFGNGGHSHWTQVLAYGKRKFNFYNPIKQNASHISNLKRALGPNRSVPFYSTIVFYGNCELKEINYVPERTFLVKPYRLKEVIEQIRSDFEPANYSDKREVLSVLKQGVQNGESLDVQNEHISRIKNELGKREYSNDS